MRQAYVSKQNLANQMREVSVKATENQKLMQELLETTDEAAKETVEKLEKLQGAVDACGDCSQRHGHAYARVRNRGSSHSGTRLSAP